MVILTQNELNDVGCDDPNCEHTEFSMHSQCHPRSGFGLSYDKDTAILSAVCLKCSEVVAEFAIAEKH